MGIIYVLGHFAIGSSLFPFFSILYKRKKVKLLFYLKLFVFVSVFSNLSNLILYHFTKIDQTSLFTLYISIQNCLLILILCKRKIFNHYYLSFFYILLTLNFAFYIYSLTFSPSERYNYFGTFSRIIMSILSIIIIIERYFKSKDDSLFDDFIFNLSISILLYNGLQLYVSFFNTIILERADELFLYTWPIVQISSIIYYLLISRAIWKLKN